MLRFTLLVVATLVTGFNALTVQDSTVVNPIRRVVTMLQNMQKKVEEEGKRDEELFEKFMCYCKDGIPKLEKSIADATEKIPQLKSSIEETKALILQLKAELKQHKKDRKEAEDAVAKATSLREKEAAAFAKESGDQKTNLDAITKAIAALEKGMGNFLQTASAATLRKLTVEIDINSSDRDILASFLAQKQGEGYEPQSGQIVGILKAMKDTMEKEYADVLADEESAKSAFASMMEAKEKEIKANSAAIQDKLEREGEASVRIQQMMEELSDTKISLKEDTQFLADLQKNCGTREAEYEVVKKTRQEELLALADTIKILNDDDALELFKKTLPSPSLLQMKVASKQMRLRAAQMIKSARNKNVRDAKLDFIALALRGQKVSFDKIISMMDELMALLKKEQTEDDDKKAYCLEQLDQAEDKLKVLDQKTEDLEKRIKEDKFLVENGHEMVEELEQEIKDLDKQVGVATENRKEEHEEFQTSLANNKGAKDLLALAKNRLYKFYEPSLYKEPPKTQTGDALLQDAPAPPPEAVGPYKKRKESSGVIEMIDMLATDLDKEIQAMEVQEKESQKEYEVYIEDSAEERTSDTKQIARTEEAKAEAEVDLTKATADKKSTMKKAYATTNVIGDTHQECDWLLKNYDVRKEARAGEIDAMSKAKQVLNGADYSL